MGFIASLFGGGKKSEAPPAPQPLPQAPTVDDAAEKAEDKTRKKRATLAAGSKSIYSSPLGVGGEANVARSGLKAKLGE
jgi:hypothetical protein